MEIILVHKYDRGNMKVELGFRIARIVKRSFKQYCIRKCKQTAREANNEFYKYFVVDFNNPFTETTHISAGILKVIDKKFGYEWRKIITLSEFKKKWKFN